jgi:hypothetical protein
VWLDWTDCKDDPRHGVSSRKLGVGGYLLTVYRMTCRLPQTPRTPTGAAAHYFDDVFSTTSKPKKPHHLRRSSTSRSIGFRSDWGESANEDDDETVSSPANRRGSVGHLDPEAIEQKNAMQERLNHYVSGQLERVKTGIADVETDEFETTLDGSSDQKPNGHARRERNRRDYFEQDPYFSK